MARKISVEIVGDSRSLEKAFAKSSKSANGFSKDLQKTGRRSKSVFGGMGKAIGFATGALGVAGLAGAAKAAFGEFQEAQKVTAQTAAVLKSTGNAANVSAKQVDDLAGSLSNMSGVDDEAIASGENLLLTFTNVRNEVGKGNDVFKQATGVMLDMSTALGQDMKTSAIQLGKALNDPAKGISSLRRVGVTFTAEQKKMIKTLVASGKTMQAQKIILAELRREFGGSAKAAGDTLSGKLNILKNTVLNLSATLVAQLMPAITKLVDTAVKWLSNTKNQKQILDTVKTAAAALATVLKVLKTAFETLSRVVGGSKNAIIVLIAAFVAWKAVKMASAVAGVARSFGLLTARTNASTVATRTSTVASTGLAKSFLGKAGLVVGAGLAAYELTTLALKLTGLDKKLRAAGGAAYDLAAKLGLVNDAGKQFQGKTLMGQEASGFIRRQAARLQAQGMTPQQSANRILKTHPGLAERDVGVLAGVGKGGVNVNVTQNFQAPTLDRHREALYARNATRAVFDH